MSWLFSTITTGITAFVITNLDDLVVLMIFFFFTQVNTSLRYRNIITGRYLGFTVIILSSLPGYLGSLIVPRAWIGLLGLVPIIIGLSSITSRKINVNEVQSVGDEMDYSSVNGVLRLSICNLVGPQTFKVAAVTFANGGDNIGLYVPLFASGDLTRLAVILSVFFLLTGAWCYFAYQLTRHPSVALVLTRYGNSLVPFVLISLGTVILLKNGTLSHTGLLRHDPGDPGYWSLD